MRRVINTPHFVDFLERLMTSNKDDASTTGAAAAGGEAEDGAAGDPGPRSDQSADTVARMRRQATADVVMTMDAWDYAVEAVRDEKVKKKGKRGGKGHDWVGVVVFVVVDACWLASGFDDTPTRKALL